MEQRMKVYDYATRLGISMSSAYRHIKAGKLETETIDGVLHVVVNEEQLGHIEKDNGIIDELRERIEHQQEEIEYLRQKLDESEQARQQMQQDSTDAQQRSDTIILQLTRQLSEQTNLLEDMRQSRFEGLWSRVKTAFGFA